MNRNVFGLGGKTAVVTGASSGIGAAIAQAMSSAGARVVLVGRDRARLAAQARIIAKAGRECRTISIDLTAARASRIIVAETIKVFGTVDIVVHSAGIWLPGPFERAPLASLDRQWETNVRAPYTLTKAALPYLKPNGVVIFVSSISAHVGFSNSAAYCATKGAVELLAKALTVEFGREGVRFNCIAPGFIRTPMNERHLADREYEDAAIASTPSGRIGTVDEIAPAAVYLASPAASYVFGATLLVDGGWVAQ